MHPMVKIDPAGLLQGLNGPGRPLLTLFGMLLSNRPLVGEADLAGLIGGSPKTARLGLAALQRLGLAERAQYHRGWRLTPAGRKLLLDSPMLWAEGPPPQPDPVNPPVLTASPAPPGKPATGWPLTGDGIYSSDSESDLTPTPVNPAERQTAILERAARICQACETLWGTAIWPETAGRVAQNELRAQTDRRVDRASGGPPGGLDDLLGWIVHCAQNASRLNNPAAVVAANIRMQRRPAARYRQRAGEYLPPGFLKAAGLEALLPDYLRRSVAAPPSADDPAEDDEFDEFDEADDPDEAEAGPPVDPSALEPVFGGRSGVEVWRIALDQLRGEMPRTAFEQYLAPARLTACQAGRFIVQASDAYAAAWLNARLARLLGRILCGLTNHSDAAVEFGV